VRWIRPISRSFVASVAAGALCACSTGSDRADGLTSRVPDEEDLRERGIPSDDPFTPTELRIHPLTRLSVQPQTGMPHIDAHIELRDAAGDPVKSLGELTLVLFRGERVGQSQRQAVSWSVDEFGTVAGNARAFDHVTRTYRFRLEGLPSDLDPNEGLALEARLRVGDAPELSSRLAF